MRVADYIAEFLIRHEIKDGFSVVGGGSMFLNDAFAHCDGLNITYNHHEQAATMAAESYYKVKGKMALVCVTTGPGGTNTITGLLGAYQDSIPMFVISGQVRYETTVESTGLPLRQFGGQEHQIIDTVRNVTKYVEMVRKPEDIRYYLEKAFYEATHGRRGPVWLDIPLNVQSSEVNPEQLKGFMVEKSSEDCLDDARIILDELTKAERPLFVVGSAVRTVGYTEKFLELSHHLNVPVTYPLNVPDAISAEDELAMGCFGGVGNRAANFAVQNADLLVVFGCRMAFAHIGFNYQAFSPNSKKITIDVDPAEQEKPTMKRDIKITADVGVVIDSLLELLSDDEKGKNDEWMEYCKYIRKKYPIFQEHHKMSVQNRVNPYFMANSIRNHLKEDEVICIGNSSGLDPLLQLGVKKLGQRIILNCNCGSMGYCLPAGIGAYVASKKPVVVYTGDGCIQMNIQELETIVYNKMPIKIIVLNNGGYGGVVATQKNFFEGRLSGCTSDSGVGMPDFEKLAYAYGLKYYRMASHEDSARIDELFQWEGPALMEVMQDTEQDIEPCVARRQDENGNLVSTGIDDMAPFLTMEEYQSNQFDNWKKER